MIKTREPLIHRVIIQITDDQYKALAKISDETGNSRSEVLRQLIEQAKQQQNTN